MIDNVACPPVELIRLKCYETDKKWTKPALMFRRDGAMPLKEQHLTYNIRISSLKQMGLVEQQMDKYSNYYVLSYLALKLKDYALSSDENAKKRSSYLELNLPQDFEVATDDEVDNIINNIFN